jgi:hypothetical protein
MKRARAQLQAVSLEEAQHIFFARLAEFFHAREEEIKTPEALGRVTSRSVRAQQRSAALRQRRHGRDRRAGRAHALGQPTPSRKDFCGAEILST